MTPAPTGPDVRFLSTFKSGYGGHVPMFRRNVSEARDFCGKTQKTALLYRKYYLDLDEKPVGAHNVPCDNDIIQMGHEVRKPMSAASPLRPRPAANQSGGVKEVAPGVCVDAWSLQAIPSNRQEYPKPLSKRPKALAKIVGYGGHRKGAAFISGETFTQCQLMTDVKDQLSTRAGLETYEPDKSIPKGRHITYNSASPDEALNVNTNLVPRLPTTVGGGLLRNSRGPPCVSPSRRKPFPAYPIMRGPARVRTGGQDVFLTN